MGSELWPTLVLVRLSFKVTRLFPPLPPPPPNSNHLEKSAARALGPLLFHPALTDLTVDDNPLGHEGLATIVAALRASPALVSLSLRSCCGRSDGGDGMAAVSTLLMHDAPTPPRYDLMNKA